MIAQYAATGTAKDGKRRVRVRSGSTRSRMRYRRARGNVIRARHGCTSLVVASPLSERLDFHMKAGWFGGPSGGRTLRRCAPAVLRSRGADRMPHV
jgi:hypothetical protein